MIPNARYSGNGSFVLKNHAVIYSIQRLLLPSPENCGGGWVVWSNESQEGDYADHHGEAGAAKHRFRGQLHVCNRAERYPVASFLVAGFSYYYCRRGNMTGNGGAMYKIIVQ